MRKSVTLITGASGEIGHGLIERLVADGGSPIITIDLKPVEKDLRRMVEREYVGSILEEHLLERILAEYEVDAGLPPRRHAVDARRVHAADRPPGQRRGHPQAARLRPGAGRVRTAGRWCSCTRRRSPPTVCPTWRRRPRRARSRRRTGTCRPRCTAATSCTASSSVATTPATTSSSRRDAVGQGGLSCDPLSRPDLGLHGALGRHLRLRAGDGARCGAG